MIRITQLKLPVGHDRKELWKKAARMLRVSPKELLSLDIRRQSLDARKKPELFYIYTVDVKLASSEKEKGIVRRIGKPQVILHREEPYVFVKAGTERLFHRPVIVGTGPAGLFCGLLLARHGYRPLLLERGMEAERRKKAVDCFWKTGKLNPCSNVQFGEGGAGTFSDGKLNTLVKDSGGRNRLVLEIFREFGADEEILYQNKPHIGTDVLSRIVTGMREEIVRLGGEVRFECQVTGLIFDEGNRDKEDFQKEKEQAVIKGVITERGERILSEAVILAVGHSARDTFPCWSAAVSPCPQRLLRLDCGFSIPRK